MPDEDFLDRVQLVMLEEGKNPEGWWYLSFAEDERGFLGVAIVRGRGVVTAALTAKSLGIDPGGEVLAISLGDDVPPARFCNRLLSKGEIDEAYAASGGGVAVGRNDFDWETDTQV